MWKTAVVVRGSAAMSSGAEDSGTVSAMQDLFVRDVESLGDSATLPSQTTQQRTPLKLQELKLRGVDVRSIRYLVPEGQDGRSTNPCLMIHEKKLSALLALEEAHSENSLRAPCSKPGHTRQEAQQEYSKDDPLEAPRIIVVQR